MYHLKHGSVNTYDLFTDLILVPGEAAALHGAGVEVALVIELEAGKPGV